MEIRQLYYLLKPLIPRNVQLFIRRKRVALQKRQFIGIWPVDEGSCLVPEGWAGWPGTKKFSLVLTHDVDNSKGQERCRFLSRLEMKIGFSSSFNFVPERYSDNPLLRQELADNGFEVGVHGLNHDGNLYKSKEEFDRRAVIINRYIKDWRAKGFRSPAMHHNLEWLKALDIEYDASTLDTDPFEPQPDGVGTIFPFWVPRDNGTGYVELPYTLPQDFTLFVLMKEKTIDIWKKKLDWIAEKGGMALINTHPDYMNFSGDKCGIEEYPVKYYEEFLEYVKTQYEGQYWHCLPREMTRFWREEVVGIRNAEDKNLGS